MGDLKVIRVKQSILSNNDNRANELRAELKKKGIFLINVMSSPGSGKTTLLVNLINRLKDKLKIGVMEADIDADVDANTVSKQTGVKTIQLNTSGECHLDAKMTSDGIDVSSPMDWNCCSSRTSAIWFAPPNSTPGRTSTSSYSRYRRATTSRSNIR